VVSWGLEKTMAPRETDLGTAELEVLKALWVMNTLHEQGRQVAYTTVLTFLTRLEQKGFVKSNKSEVAYVYRPAVTRARITKSRLRSLIEQLYDGDAAPLVLQLMREQNFTADEIAELQKLIDHLDTGARQSTSRL
jgi:predicted transcriptional regulator